MKESTAAEPGSLIVLLPQLLPLAVAWATDVSDEAAFKGTKLEPWQIDEARDVGVQHPDKVRLCKVDTMPMPSDPDLSTAAIQSGLLNSGTLGLTLGYTIFICRTHINQRRLLRHELRHVAQYEAAGGIAPFLAEYLSQILLHGYQAAELEQDARRHEC